MSRHSVKAETTYRYNGKTYRSIDTVTTAIVDQMQLRIRQRMQLHNHPVFTSTGRDYLRECKRYDEINDAFNKRMKPIRKRARRRVMKILKKKCK